MNDELVLALKKAVVEASADEHFVHHKWFVNYHLDIVEQISSELCDIYTEADRLRVKLLVWLHDYEKIIDFDNQYNTELVATRALMEKIGFDEVTIRETLEQINVYNAKTDLPNAPIETQIVSSSDAASHLVGPFITLYWYENTHKTMEQLQSDNLAKLSKDWSKKITLPEIKARFGSHYERALEIAGKLPEKYLS